MSFLEEAFRKKRISTFFCLLSNSGKEWKGEQQRKTEENVVTANGEGKIGKDSENASW